MGGLCKIDRALTVIIMVGFFFGFVFKDWCSSKAGFLLSMSQSISSFRTKCSCHCSLHHLRNVMSFVAHNMLYQAI